MENETVASRLAGIARDVRSSEGVTHTTDEICAAAVELLGHPSGAGITLVRRRRQVETAAATSEVVRLGDQLQYELGEGPCLDAVWETAQVYSGSLGTEERWPRWSTRMAEELGVHSMLCTQLFTRDDLVGALNIYSAERYAFDAEARETARLLAAHAAVAVVAAQQIENLEIAVDRRTTIGKALGIVMVRYGVDDDKALAVLRRLSSHQNRKLYDVALSVVREVGLPADEPPA